MDGEVFRIELDLTAKDNTTTGAKKAQESIEQVEKATKRARQENDRFTQSAKKQEEQLKKIHGKRWKMVLEAVDKASSVIKSVSRSAGSLAGKTFRFSLKVLDLATSPLRAIGRAATSVMGLLGMGAGVYGGVVAPIKLADSLAEAQVGFETMLKSADAAKKMMKDIKEFAIRTPFETMGIVQQSQRMMAYGWDPKDVLKDMERIGNAAAATGKGAEGMGRIVLALGQIKMKGKVSAEEMNQLAEAGIRAREYVAQGLGVSIQKAVEMMEDGKVESATAIQYIMDGMKEFDGQMDKTAKKTVKGLLSQIKDTFTVSVVEKWGSGLQKGVLAGLDKMNTFLTKNRGNLEKIGDTLGKWGEQISTGAVAEIEKMARKLSDLVASPQWEKATTLGEKAKIVWSEMIEKPFMDWWSGGGKKRSEEWGVKIGTGLGTGIGKFIMGVADAVGSTGELTGMAKAGADAGSSFAKAFAEAFDADKVIDKLFEAFANRNKKMAQNAMSGNMKGSDWLTLYGDLMVGGAVGGAVGNIGKVGKGIFGAGKSLFNFIRGAGTAAGAAGAAGSAAGAAGAAGAGAAGATAAGAGVATGTSGSLGASIALGADYFAQYILPKVVSGGAFAAAAAPAVIAAVKNKQRIDMGESDMQKAIADREAGANGGYWKNSQNPWYDPNGTFSKVESQYVSASEAAAQRERLRKVEATISMAKPTWTLGGALSGQYGRDLAAYNASIGKETNVNATTGNPYLAKQAQIQVTVSPQINITADTDKSDILKVIEENIVDLSDVIGEKIGNGLAVQWGNWGG